MRHYSTPLSIAIGTALLSLPLANALAETALPPVSIGAGVRTSFVNKTVSGAPASTNPNLRTDTESSDFLLDSARIYLSGKVTDNISLMFNTEYNGTNQSLIIMDAAAQFAFSDAVNIWAGRFLAPSDRANLYGPYYASHWGVYQDGVQDGYPMVGTPGANGVGRDDGVMYWGQFGIAKVSAGVFDSQGTKGDSAVLSAARVQLDFWDPEGGYYLNGTYYGDKDLLAVGVAAQSVDGDSAYSVDFLLEKKLGGAGVLTVEAEYAKYDGLGGYGNPRTTTPASSYTSSDGAYVLGAYLFPSQIGIGKFQVLAKVSQANYDYATGSDVDQDTIEVNLNYIIKQFNARVSLFYIDSDFSPETTALVPVTHDSTQIGIGLQVQM
jgi:hypothetical protein